MKILIDDKEYTLEEARKVYRELHDLFSGTGNPMIFQGEEVLTRPSMGDGGGR